jgi:hypothetical protein
VFNLTRYKQWQAFFGTLSLFFGAVFFLAGHAGVNAMAPEQYGDLAVSATVRAWATAQLSAAFILCMGIVLNGRWRWSPAARLAGVSVLILLMTMLAASAFSAPEGWPVGVFCTGFALWGLPVVWWNLVDLIGAVRWGRHG